MIRAVVTSVSPLRVRLDGSDSDLPAIRLLPTLWSVSVNDDVAVQTPAAGDRDRRLLVLGAYT